MTYAVRLFDDKNIAALKVTQMSDVSGVIDFLQQIVSCWNIVNVKSPTKGIHLRQEKSYPIREKSSTDPILLFQEKFVTGLKLGNQLNPPNLKESSELANFLKKPSLH